MDQIQAWFDISIGEEGAPGYSRGRVVIQVFQKELPMTVENFRAICTGEMGHNLFYKTRVFHRVIPGFMMQGGKIVPPSGEGYQSIYGNKYQDEGVWMCHSGPGMVSMANSGPDSNGSQFFVCYDACPHLDGKHTVFGRVIHGYQTCLDVASVPQTSKSSVPDLSIKIADCGIFSEEFRLKPEQCDSLSLYQ